MIIYKDHLMYLIWFVYFCGYLIFPKIPGMQIGSLLIITTTLLLVKIRKSKRVYSTSRWYVLFTAYCLLSMFWSVYNVSFANGEVSVIMLRRLSQDS